MRVSRFAVRGARGWFATAVAGAMIAALVGGCGSEEATPPAPSAPASPLAARLAPGTLQIEIGDGAASITCEDVPRREVLQRLAEAAGFTLEIGDLPPEMLSIRSAPTPLSELLPLLLRGVPYQVDYEIDPVTGAHVLAWLGVGGTISGTEPAPEPINAATKAAPSGGEPPETTLDWHRPRTADLSHEERTRIHDAASALAEERETELLEKLEDSDPSVRAEAVLELPLEGDADQRAQRLGRLSDLLGDPDSTVRMAAVERLGDADSPAALQAILPALADANREVVLEAITAIEDMDDAAAIPHLKPLLQNRDAEIRESAESAIEWLQW